MSDRPVTMSSSVLRCARRGVASLLLACSFGLVGASVGAAAADAAAKNQTCAAVTAGGHSYSVSATNVSCSFAQQWATKVAGKRLKSNATRSALSGGPSGYQCFAGAKAKGDAEKVAANVQVSGNCAKGSGLGNSPYFNWSIKSAFD